MKGGIASYYLIPNGCSKHCDCNSCPFPDCRASIKDYNKSKAIQELHDKVLHLAWNRVSTDSIVERTGLSFRHVKRIIADQSLTT